MIMRDYFTAFRGIGGIGSSADGAGEEGSLACTG